ncbi:MAG: carboxylesterase family protein [Synergistaceae bacterium]|nr:carboxylesterase family protein [Synergistaceae bacterium]
MSISKKVLSLLLAVLAAFSFATCSSAEEADLVVYGKIFTSEGNKIVEAFAVKDGRYVYVGDKKGAEAFVDEDKTEVVDYTGKGLVMPGCGNGHAHYMLGYALKTVGTVIDLEETPEHFLKETVPAAVKKARNTGATATFGQGWNLMRFQKHIPTRQELDAICSDIPMYFLDDECHKALANTILLVKAGIMKEDGSAGKTELRGGEIGVDDNGIPNGFLSEQAQTYVRSFLDDIYTLDMAISNVAEIEHHMLSEGYTMYHEGWGNYFVNTNYYKAVQQLDKAGKLHFVVGLPYEIESWMDMDEALARAVDAKKFASKRVMPRWIKLLMDGTVETGTGYVEPLYPDGHQGIPNWKEEELTELTRKANEKGLTIHIHALGNKAVNCAVNAFVNGGKPEMRNTLVHVRNVNDADYQRIADHNIYVTSGVTWHHMPAGAAEYIREHGMTPAGQEDKSYPMKSYFDYGTPASMHSDYPALSGSPDDPFGIMEIAVTGVLHSENGSPWWPEELITREQALTALTINCAKQMFLEDERGSVKEGKYADFLLVNKDVLTCPATEIHTAKPSATYFEGKKVFSSEEQGGNDALAKAKAELRAQYGENKPIIDDKYDESLAAKCINGTFVGRKSEGVITFKGIPFVGKQPVGKYRWKAPVGVVPDDGVYEAYYFGKASCQDEALGLPQGEDCLYLNVWKADEKNSEKKPVIVWIHGGAFVSGGTGLEIFDCTNFVKENPDVIVVSIQYRLGALGFLHLSHLEDGKDYPDAQNLGLLDQKAALKWLHENIAGFGGDPDNITIWGESAGAGSVTMLPLINGSQQYFKRVIAQSGSPSQTNSLEESIVCTNDLMDALGCKTVADLQNVDARKLVDTAGKVIALRIFPVRDGIHLPFDPYSAYANGAAKNIAFLQGCNKDEMNCFVFDWGVENFKAWAADRTTKKYAHLLTDDEKTRIESYCNEAGGEDWEPDSRLFGHSWFIDGAIKMSESQTQGGGKSYTYYYRVESSPELKAAHFEEVPILFCHPEFSGGRQDYDETFSKTMRRMWVQFAKTADPSLSADMSPDGKAKSWPLYDLENKNVMVFDEFDIHPATESELKIVDWERTYFLIKYYML